MLATPGTAECSRLGMAVPKKVMPLATRRNSIRRRIREGIRHIEPELPKLDIVVVLRNCRDDPLKTRDSAFGRDLRKLLDLATQHSWG